MKLDRTAAMLVASLSCVAACAASSADRAQVAAPASTTELTSASATSEEETVDLAPAPRVGKSHRTAAEPAADALEDDKAPRRHERRGGFGTWK